MTARESAGPEVLALLEHEEELLAGGDFGHGAPEFAGQECEGGCDEALLGEGAAGVEEAAEVVAFAGVGEDDAAEGGAGGGVELVHAGTVGGVVMGFKVGDLVRLRQKAGVVSQCPPEMVVEDVEDTLCFCVWFWDGEVRRRGFKAALLESTEGESVEEWVARAVRELQEAKYLPRMVLVTAACGEGGDPVTRQVDPAERVAEVIVEALRGGPPRG